MEADVHYFVPSYPIAGGEGTGTPQQELSVDLDELAQADAEAGYGFWTTCKFKKNMGIACDGTEHDYSLAQTEADVAEYFWNSCAFKKAMGEECDGDSLAQISP